jgi:hypothetical protein
VSGLFIIRGVRCPACGRKDLYLTGRGVIECIYGGCPQPSAARDLLANPQIDHIVEFTADGWTLKHPLLERADDDLFRCEAGRHLTAQLSPEMPPGRYTMAPEDGNGGWEYTLIERGPDDVYAGS